jgi:hypothetical protein
MQKTGIKGEYRDETFFYMAVAPAGLFLQIRHFSVDATFLPLYANVFRICRAGAEKTRPATWFMVDDEANCALPSVGRERV